MSFYIEHEHERDHCDFFAQLSARITVCIESGETRENPQMK
jgi:hypothetical protein